LTDGASEVHVKAGLFGAVVVFAVISSVISAQVLRLPAPEPAVTAAGAQWQTSDAPVFYAGNFYYPSGPTVFFDGYVMVQTGSYRGVPVYEDVTVEPDSVVYVPIGGNLMRPYERRREGELAGTTGSRAPSFPIEHDVELSVRSTAGISGEYPPVGPPEATISPEGSRPTSRTQTPQRASGSAGREEASPRSGPAIISLPPPDANRGVWIEFAGERWHSVGRAVAFSPERFERIGTLDGFPVYCGRGGSRDVIYVPSVAGGPLAPFDE
jgi:hypothetical protein